MEQSNNKIESAQGSPSSLEGVIDKKKLLYESSLNLSNIPKDSPLFNISLYKHRGEEMKAQVEEGNAESMIETKKAFDVNFMYKPYNWQEATMDGELVSKVAADTAKQMAVYKPTTPFQQALDYAEKPQAVLERSNKEGKEEALAKTDEILTRFQKRNGLPTQERVTSPEVDIDIGKMEQEETIRKDDVFDFKDNLSAEDWKEAEEREKRVAEARKEREKKDAEAREKRDAEARIRKEEEVMMQESEKTHPLPENLLAQAREDAKTLEAIKKARAEGGVSFKETITKSQENLEQIKTLNETLRNASLEKLARMGVKKETIENNFLSMKARPGFKIALGVALAGLSVATGGATSAFSKAFSAGSFAFAAYEKEYQKKLQSGQEIKRGRIALKSLGKGILLMLATSVGVSLVADAFNGFEKTSEMMSSIKEKVSTLMGSAQTSPNIVSPDAAGYDPEALLPNTYTVQPGDNLTKIMKDQVISHLPGAERFTDTQKENMIQNLLLSDKLPDTIKQFVDPNLIHPGKTINLAQLREALTSASEQFGPASLLDHAKNLKH